MEATKYGSMSGSRSDQESVGTSSSRQSNAARSRAASTRSNGSSRYISPQSQHQQQQQQQQQQQRVEEPADLHELAKGWKAAIARATDPATR